MFSLDSIAFFSWVPEEIWTVYLPYLLIFMLEENQGEESKHAPKQVGVASFLADTEQ